MLEIGTALQKAVAARIYSGQNAKDQPSKPLKGVKKGNYVPYASQKQRKGLQPFRDWCYSGRTLRSMKVLSVNENGGRVGFTDAKTNAIAGYLNQIDKAFGISPNDTKAMEAALDRVLRSGDIVQLQQIA